MTVIQVRGLAIYKPGLIHNFLHQKMPKASQKYDSYCLFFWYFDLMILLFDIKGLLLLNFPQSSVFLWFYFLPCKEIIVLYMLYWVLVVLFSMYFTKYIPDPGFLQFSSCWQQTFCSLYTWVFALGKFTVSNLLNVKHGLNQLFFKS